MISYISVFIGEKRFYGKLHGFWDQGVIDKICVHWSMNTVEHLDALPAGKILDFTVETSCACSLPHMNRFCADAHQWLDVRSYIEHGMQVTNAQMHKLDMNFTFLYADDP